jgi:FKBP-type peptidyl-prolyl cis-trans isomerase FkpA
MKRMFIAMACFVAIVYAAGCGKSFDNQASCTGPKAYLDTPQLSAFAKKYGITPVVDTSLLYYQIIVPGSGASPTASSKVFVHYVERLMDGSYIDSTVTSTRYSMDSLIKGWQYGLPKIKSGGRIKLLLPSALGLSCLGNGGSIPANAPLYFDIYLDSLK